MSEMGWEGLSLDFRIEVEDELAEAREVAVKAVDRADALAELRRYVLEEEAELGRPVSVRDVFETRDETKRARLTALADRIAGTGEEN